MARPKVSENAKEKHSIAPRPLFLPPLATHLPSRWLTGRFCQSLLLGVVREKESANKKREENEGNSYLLQQISADFYAILAFFTYLRIIKALPKNWT